MRSPPRELKTSGHIFAHQRKFDSFSCSSVVFVCVCGVVWWSVFSLSHSNRHKRLIAYWAVVFFVIIVVSACAVSCALCLKPVYCHDEATDFFRLWTNTAQARSRSVRGVDKVLWLRAYDCSSVFSSSRYVFCICIRRYTSIQTTAEPHKKTNK